MKTKRIDFSNKFDRQLRKSPIEIKATFHKKLKIFRNNPYERQLNNHTLSGKFQGYRSINITGDWRAIYSERRKNKSKIIIFEVLGKHSILYK